MDWGLVLHDVAEKLARIDREDKLTPICPYIFHFYKEQQIFLSLELAAYNLNIDFIEYNCILDPDTTPAASKSEQEQNPDPPMLEGWNKLKISPNMQVESSQRREIQSGEAVPNQSEVEKNMEAFNNAIA